MIIFYFYRNLFLHAGNSYERKVLSFIWKSNVQLIVIFFFILSGCHKIIQPSRSDLLTSTVWGETNYEIKDPQLYTCVFEPGGRYYTSFKGYQTYSGYWKLFDDHILKIDQWEVEISKLTENTLEYMAEVDFYGLYTAKKTFTLQSLKGTEVGTIGVSNLSKTSGTLHGFLRSSEPTDLYFSFIYPWKVGRWFILWFLLSIMDEH